MSDVVSIYIKTGIFGRPTTKVHLGRAWIIEFSYGNIREESIRTKGRARGTVPRTRPFVRIDSPRIFLYGNLILHARVCADVSAGIIMVSITKAATHARMHAYTHARMHAYTHARMPACTHARMHTCTHARMHERLHARTHCTHGGKHACLHARIHACTHARMHACTHARRPTCTLGRMHAGPHAGQVLAS